MKALKITLITLCSIFAIIYLAFLFAIPAFVKLDDYTYELKSSSNANQGLIIKAEKIRVSTAWNLSAGLKIGQINTFYQNGDKFGQVDNLDITVSIPYLLIKKIKLDKIALDKVIARLGVENDGTFTIEKFIPTNEGENSEQTSNLLPYGLEFSENMPNISANKYSITLNDISADKKYAIKGSDLKITDFHLNKRIKLKANGEIFLQDRKQFVYFLDITSHVMPDFTNQQTTESNSKRVNITEILNNIYKLNLTARVIANVKLKGSFDDLKTYGTASIQNLSVKVQGTQLPESRIDLGIYGDTIKFLSDIYTGKNEKANIDGLFQYGKKQYIVLNVNSKHLELKSVFALINASLNAFGLSNINGIQANGIINANFNIKSDFKTINSNGYLKVTDANIFYNIYNVALKNINANVDFSSNQININNASANFNGAPISIKGAINSNAYANLSILADKIPVKAGILALGQIKLLNENIIKSGLITLNGTIKGKLDTVKPQINILLSDLNIYNKPNKATIFLSNAKIEAETNGAKTNGICAISGLKVIIKGLPTFSIPNSKISFNEKDIKFDDVYVNLNNSKLSILGHIFDYSSPKINIDISVVGKLVANDLRNSLDKNIRKTVKATGKLPLAITITGNDKVQHIKGQILANNTNHLSIVDIYSLNGKTSLINASLKIENNALKIEDLSINALSTNRGLGDNFNNNLAGSTKVISIKGLINNLSSKVQQISALNITIPSQITVSIPSFAGSKAQIKGDINISGTTANPVITGMINIPTLRIPTLNVSGKNLTVNATKNVIDIFCNQLNVADSVINIVATMNSNFNKGIYIRSMEFNATNLNADTMMQTIAKLPQSEIAPGTNAGITVVNGKSKIDRLQSGTIVATNIFANFNLYNNLCKITDIEAIAYGGKIVGNVDYNLLYSSTKINLQGRNLAALTATYAATGIKNLMQGSLDFDANNITARGLTDVQIIQSLKGDVKFQVLNGQMGTLGKLENLLYAQNILANNLLKTTMGAVVGAVKVKKTGDFKYIKGVVHLSNGWANLEKVQTSGPAMSMYIRGRYNILNNYASLIILGRLSNEVVDVLGPIGNFSVNSLIASIPKIGQVTSSLINQITTNPSGENLTLLPELSPAQSNTKEFKAAVEGIIDSASAVKYFKWLATPKAEAVQQTTTTQNTISNTQQQAQQAVQNVLNKVIKVQPTQPQQNIPQTPMNNNGVADFINKLPNLKN